MRKALDGNGNGNGDGASGLLQSSTTQTSQPSASTPISESEKSKVSLQTADGVKLRGVPVRTTRHQAVFEVYGPAAVPQLSEALQKFQITLKGRMVYSGRAVVRNLVDEGTKFVCETTLDEAGWKDLNQVLALQQEGRAVREFKSFLNNWQRFYTILPEFKTVVADMQTFFYDLWLWLERVELEIQALPVATRTQAEQKIIDQLIDPIVQGIDVFIARFESIAAGLEDDQQPAYSAYLRRQLHPLVLSSPFAYRAFHKPLGYPGDYKTVEMMIRPPYEGSTLFAKVINVWLLGQLPTHAHRNRIKHLVSRIELETYRVTRAGSTARIFNFACGPAFEIQNFFSSAFREKVELTLADFNQETLEYVAKATKIIKDRLSIGTSIQFQRKSVYQILKDYSTNAGKLPEYDFIYCAGLFDYLPDTTCKKLMDVFYDWLAPGGLLLVTNVTDVMNNSRPFRFSMEYILDWRLIYRNRKQLADLAPAAADKDYVNVLVENAGANLFLEIRKANHA